MKNGIFSGKQFGVKGKVSSHGERTARTPAQKKSCTLTNWKASFTIMRKKLLRRVFEKVKKVRSIKYLALLLT